MIQRKKVLSSKQGQWIVLAIIIITEINYYAGAGGYHGLIT